MLLQSYFFLTQSTTPIIGSVAKLFGYLMNAIYDFFGSAFGIHSLGLAIVVFTILTRLLLLPLAFKQQKSMVEMQKVQPEITKLQNKYKNKKDPQSQQKMQAEMSALYKKHNVSPFGGCLPLLIQMPILFGLYRVLRNIPAYITNIRDYYDVIVNQIVSVSGYADKLETLKEANSLTVSNFDATQTNKIIDLLYQFQTSTWEKFYEAFPSIQDQVQVQVDHLTNIYNMFGINLADKPDLATIGILIPILNVVFQFIQMKISQKTQQNNGSAATAQTQQAQSMKTMMYTMPLISGFFSLSLPAGLGLYWLVGTAFMIFQQLIINKHIHKGVTESKE